MEWPRKPGRHFSVCVVVSVEKLSPSLAHAARARLSTLSGCVCCVAVRTNYRCASRVMRTHVATHTRLGQSVVTLSLWFALAPAERLNRVCCASCVMRSGALRGDVVVYIYTCIILYVHNANALTTQPIEHTQAQTHRPHFVRIKLTAERVPHSTAGKRVWLGAVCGVDGGGHKTHVNVCTEHKTHKTIFCIRKFRVFLRARVEEEVLFTRVDLKVDSHMQRSREGIDFREKDGICFKSKL